MELTTAQAIHRLQKALNFDEPTQVTVGDNTLFVVEDAPLFVTDGCTVYRIIGIDFTDEEAAFVVIDELHTSTTYGKIICGMHFVYPIRDLLDEAIGDFSLLLAERVEAYTSRKEAVCV